MVDQEGEGRWLAKLVDREDLVDRCVKLSSREEEPSLAEVVFLGRCCFTAVVGSYYGVRCCCGRCYLKHVLLEVNVIRVVSRAFVGR